mgnify:CR=1 FL=1
MERFGFGDYTGIDILEESRAIMPSVQWKRARYNQPWYTGETISVGIGQSYWTVTPLQLAQALSIMVNKGEIKVPRLLKATQEKVLNEETGVIEEFTSELMYDDKRPIAIQNEKNWDLVLEFFQYCVSQFFENLLDYFHEFQIVIDQSLKVKMQR